MPLRQQILEVNGQAVYLKNTNDTKLSYLLTIEQFEALRSFVEVIAERDAVVPLLDFSAFRPQLDIDGVAGFQHLAERGDMD